MSNKSAVLRLQRQKRGSSALLHKHETFLGMMASTLVSLLLIFSPTGSARAQDCTQTPLPRLSAGIQAQVIVQGEGEDGRLRVRENPGVGHPMVAEMATDDVFFVIGGPECMDRYYWWNVVTPLGMQGWSAESVPGTYFARPLDQPNPDPLPALSDREIQRFEMEREEMIAFATTSLTHLSWGPDAETLLRFDPGDCSPIIRDAQSNEPLFELEVDICAHYILWHMTDALTSVLIFDAIHDLIYIYELSGDPLVVELAAVLAPIPLLSERYPLLRWADNGDVYLLLYTGEQDSLLHWWQSDQWSGSEVVVEPVIQQVPLPFRAVFSPDASRWASQIYLTDVQVVPMSNFNLQTLFAGHTDEITAVSWNPDSDKIATGAKDGSIFIWDVETRERLLEFSADNSAINALTWNRQGTLIASKVYSAQTNKIRIWDALTGQLLLTFTAAGLPVNVMQWSPDDRQIITHTDSYHAQAAIIWQIDELPEP